MYPFRTLLKNEAEAVINGKQWLLSCFGPFKESVVVPNFIPDQSFEEIRIAFMENSKNGNIQSYLNNLMTEYNNALRKMNELKQPSSDTLQLIASIYNTSNTSDQKPNPAQTQAPNPFQSSNIFGGSTQQQQTMPSSSIFGASTTQNNPFQQANTQNPTNSIFGSSTANNPVQSSAFSFNQASQDQQKPSIFQSSVFGSTQTQTSGGSVFSSAQTNIFTQQGSSVVQPPTQSVFGSAPAQQSIFGSTSAPLSVPQNTQSVFGALTASQPSQNVFGSTVAQQSQQPAQSVFGSNIAPQPVQNIFGGSTVQSQAVPNVFGGSTATQPASQNVFAAQPIQQPAQNVFGGSAALPQNLFAAQAVQQPAQNVFGGFTQNQAQSQTFGQPSSVFGSTPQSQPQSDSMSGNIFNVPAPQPGQTSQIFSGNPFQQNVTFNDEHFYSKDEDLSPEFVQAFQADSFVPGKIPIMPPSKSLAYS